MHVSPSLPPERGGGIARKRHWNIYKNVVIVLINGGGDDDDVDDVDADDDDDDVDAW